MQVKSLKFAPQLKTIIVILIVIMKPPFKYILLHMYIPPYTHLVHMHFN